MFSHTPVRQVLLIVSLFLAGTVRAEPPRAAFTENRGQWPAQVLYRAMVPGGVLFVERDAFTYVLYSGLDLHRHARPDPGPAEQPQGHAYRVHFIGGRAQGHEGALRQPHYQNHFIGNDPALWGAGCGVFGEVLLKDVWPGIDIRMDGRHGLKYDLIVAAGADPALARLRFDGPDGLALRNGALHVLTSAGTVVEDAPVVFNLTLAMERRPVRANYLLEGDVLSFELPEGFERGRTLVIDPVLTFASYTGSTADNFGLTATYDGSGHLYGGGTVFNPGYPTTIGAFDPTFNGAVDVGISKWTPDGTALVWSTYLGGARNEAPHSLVVNANDELFVMGTTGSTDFPTTPGCYDATYNGGPAVNFAAGYGFNYDTGVDLFLARFNAAATALLGATYFGGSSTDGINFGSPLTYNYGDPFRGEVALDPDGNPVVATTTSSTDMPMTPGAPQPAYGGGQKDGLVFRMDAGLTTLMWSTYLGGSGADAAYGMQFDSGGRVFVTGGTNSTDLPMAGSPLMPANSGGIDAFVARYDPNGTALLSATHLGTPQYDQAFFVQVDRQDDVYVLGQTRGNYPMAPGRYANPGSTQFIHKLSNDLSTSYWSTLIGSGRGSEDISPTAFLVSNCGQIYFSGWGGSTNNAGTPTSSTTQGLPITPGAFQSNTDGSDFYLMVLDPDAVALNYATYFGGTSAEHVDGGTSRFDKDGKVYQAVCAGCGGSNNFPTTPGAWSRTNNSPNCNLGVFKFDLNTLIARIGIAGPDTICFPGEMRFTNNSTGGTIWSWDFGDGNTSTAFAPTHTYAQPGTYTVTLVMSDQYGCAPGDTASIQVTAIPHVPATIEPAGPVCPGGSTRLMVSEGLSYLWFPPVGLSSTTARDPVATPPGPITYQVVVTGRCGMDTLSVDVLVSDPQGTAMPDTTICLGQSVTISASGGAGYTYRWSPGQSLSDTTSRTPVATPTDTTTYTVRITNPDGCEVVDSITVHVLTGLPVPLLRDTVICKGGSVRLVGPDAQWHDWRATPGLSATNRRDPLVTPAVPTWYVVRAGNLCGSILDSAFVDLVTVDPEAWPDTVVCPGNPVPLFATGGVSYQWTPATYLDDPHSPNPVATPHGPVNYTVVATDANGCTGAAALTIGILPSPTVDAGADAVVLTGTPVQLSASGTGTIVSWNWSPPTWLSCPDCPLTWSVPERSITYTITVTDGNGCTATDEVRIRINGTLYVPNTFTPDGDGINDFFGAVGSDIAEFRLLVFNRWGERIFTTHSLDGRWDGTYGGVMSQVDTYVWRVDYTDMLGEKFTLYGHVNLLR